MRSGPPLANLIRLGPTSEQRIDDHVHRDSLDTSRADDETLIRYTVSDGERSGVYLARLPPP